MKTNPLMAVLLVTLFANAAEARPLYPLLGLSVRNGDHVAVEPGIVDVVATAACGRPLRRSHPVFS